MKQKARCPVGLRLFPDLKLNMKKFQMKLELEMKKLEIKKLEMKKLDMKKQSAGQVPICVRQPSLLKVILPA